MAAEKTTSESTDLVVDAFECRPTWWAAMTAVMALAGYAIALPTACSDVMDCEIMHHTFPSTLNACAALGLSMVLLNEVISLISTYRGVSETQALVPDIKSRCLPSLLLTIMFSVLVLQHTIFAWSPTAWYASARLGAASPGPTSRPVYTMTYIEWLCIVPLLLTVSGHCAMGRPLKELARPIVVTNFYIVLSWIAMLTETSLVRWTLVVATFALYFHASWDMYQWVVEYNKAASPELPSRRLRPCLSIGLVLLFAVYGVVYMGALTGSISPWTERLCHLCLDVGSKLAMGIAFVIIRANEYHRTLTSVLKHVSTSNVALISILRGSFDFMLPCTADETGNCKLPPTSASDMLRLESELGRPIAGLQIGELLCDERERESFTAYVKNTLRQAETQDSFSMMTLSTQGEWSTEHPGQAPPVAQVLNCRMACGITAPMEKGHKAVRCAIHLSVVPQSSLTFGQTSWRLMAAVRFDQEQMPAVPEDGLLSTNEHGFEAFDAESAESTDAISGKAGSNSDGIVASLNDIARLGISNILKSVRGDSVLGDEVESQSAPSTLAQFVVGKSRGPNSVSTMADDRNPSIERAMFEQLRGLWHGYVKEALGGYEQTFRFLDDGRHVHMSLLGKTLVGQYWLRCTQAPYQLDLQVLCDDGTMPPPIPYIFTIEAGTLLLCGPTDEGMSRPMKFEGAGLCQLKRAEAIIPEALKPSGRQITDETVSMSGKSDSTRDFRQSSRGNIHSSSNSTAGSVSEFGDRLRRTPQFHSEAASEPTLAQKPAPVQKPAGVQKPTIADADAMGNVWGKCDQSMHMMQMMSVAQVGIAAATLGVLGVSALRRRS